MQKSLQKRQIIRNAIMAVTQVVVVSVILFVLYRFLLKTIGIDDLGIWSVVLSTTSVASIAKFGLSGSVIKFVAKYVARADEQAVVGVIQTAVISIGIFGGLILLIAYPFADWVLGFVMPSGSLEKALSILPYAIFSLWIMIITGVLQSGLDGYQRIDIRSTILTVAALFHLILVMILVPVYGLMGLAYARVIQTIALLIVNWVILKRLIHALPFFPYQWNRKLFREIISYGINFQAISIAQMLCEPTTKALLTKFGGLAMTGYYEMANRMLLQCRALLISANQVLVPAIADLQERSPEVIKEIYKDNFQLMLYISVPFFSIIIVLAPLISEIWIGFYESVFVLFAVLLSISLLINSISAPAYFSYLGIGNLKWNTLGHVTTAIMNAVLGLLAGFFFNGMGVVVSWVFASIIGSMMIGFSYHYQYKISSRQILPKENIGIIIACLIAVITVFIMYNQINDLVNSMAQYFIGFSVFSIIVFFPLWLHPMRRRLVGWIT